MIKTLPPIENVADEREFLQRVKKSSDSCAYFTEQFMDLNIFDYNKPYLDCEDRFVVYRSGRQCGKSRNAALKAIHFGFFAPLKASNLDEGVCNVVIASITKDQAFLIFEKISNFLKKSSILKKSIRRETKQDLELDWYDGSGYTNFVVRPIGDTGESLRGFTTHMAILDEAAYIPQPVYDAFLPSTVTTKPRILLTSTPAGKHGQFFEACEQSHTIYRQGKARILQKNKDKFRWTQFHVTTYDNPYASSDNAILEVISNTSEASRRQELLGEFIDGGNAIISHNLLEESMIPVKRPTFQYYDCGVDTSGKGKDETVITSLGVTADGLIYPVDAYTELTTDQTKLASRIFKLHNTFGYRTIFYDSTGIGDTLGDILADRFGNIPIHGINFKSEKTEMYVNLERLFEERRINLSLLEGLHIEKMRNQLAYMYWDHGKYHDQPPRARSDSHDDYPDSLALACYGQRKAEMFREIPYDLFS